MQDTPSLRYGGALSRLVDSEAFHRYGEPAFGFCPRHAHLAGTVLGAPDERNPDVQEHPKRRCPDDA